MTTGASTVHQRGGAPAPAGTSQAATEEPAAQGQARGAAIVNAFSVDVEDYFQVTALAERIDREDWPQFALRVERNTEAILDLLADREIEATFFILGWIAERCPQLVRRIADAGHEIASHGYAHIRVHEQTPEAFRSDVARTRALLEDVSGRPVVGYRAASFSLTPAMAWAYDGLDDAGYRYSSSLHPIRHDLYGAPDAPRQPFVAAPDAPIVEIPISTLQVFGRRLPCGGGGYFRLLPYGVSRWAVGKLHQRDRAPCVFYCHPWELDPDQPRIAGLSAKSRFRHYTNLRTVHAKLERLLQDFAWSRIDKVYDGVIPA